MEALFRLRRPLELLIVLGVDLENRRTSRKKWGSPWKPRSGCAVSKLDIRSKVSQRKYGPEPRHTVQNVTGNFIFTSHPIAHVFLFNSCFSRNRTNDMSFFSVRSYGALRELYGWTLRFGWVQTHMNALLFLFLHCISILYILNIHIL